MPSTLTKVLVVGAAGAAAWLIFSPSAIAGTVPGSNTPRMTGTQFLNSIQNLEGTARENAILAAALAGQTPRLFQSWAPISVSSPGHSGTVYVAPDYFGIGTDQDWIRTPMFPATAQRIADARGAVLPTKKISDLIYAQAPIKIGFTAFDPAVAGVARGSSVLYGRSNAAILNRQAGRAGLSSGGKKDIVIGALLGRSPGKVIIYGGRYTDGSPVQPYSNIHSASYVDYSHGVRLVKDTMTVDGRQMRVADVLRNPTLASLISDEGVVAANGLRYA
jgi:hypothetical protein